MALIKCPECGKEVSDKASACIHCGFPLCEVIDKSSNIDISAFQEELSKLFKEFGSSYSLHIENKSPRPDISPIVTKIKSQMSEIGEDDIESYNNYVLSMYNTFISLKYSDEKIVNTIHSLITADRLTERIQFEIMNAYKNRSAGKNYLWKRHFYPLFRTFYSLNGCRNEYKYRELFKDDFDFFVNGGIKGNSSKNQNLPKCPTCQSTNIKKISDLSKAASVAMWGLLSQKVKKQWHCNNCGSEW